MSITKAMVLAAGLGTRMEHLTRDQPKPLVQVSGRALIDHVIDALEAAGVTDVVVNAHYKAEMLMDHLGKRTSPRITISDERDQLMDTGGGVKRALQHFDEGAFFTYNSDFIWTEDGAPAIQRLASAWDASKMDALMLLCPRDRTTGFDGAGDFFMDAEGRLTRRGAAMSAPYAWMGVQILTKSAYAETPNEPFSNNLIWDQMIPKGRLFGLAHTGIGCHVGSPAGVVEAEEVLETK